MVILLEKLALLYGTEHPLIQLDWKCDIYVSIIICLIIKHSEFERNLNAWSMLTLKKTCMLTIKKTEGLLLLSFKMNS